MKRNLILEKVVASKQLRFALETEEERKPRLENDAAILKSCQLCLSFKLDVLTTSAPTTERNIDHDLLSASLILLDMYLKSVHFAPEKIAITLELLGQFLRLLDQNDRHGLSILLIY